MENILKKLGVRTISFSNPKDALKALKNNPVSILFVDHSMSEMTGDPAQVKIESSNLSKFQYKSIISKKLAPIELFDRFATEMNSGFFR